jgi:hypothetical protein
MTLQMIETLIGINVTSPSTERHECKLLLLRSYYLNLDTYTRQVIAVESFIIDQSHYWWVITYTTRREIKTPPRLSTKPQKLALQGS